jgi:hypothetical protein
MHAEKSRKGAPHEPGSGGIPAGAVQSEELAGKMAALPDMACQVQGFNA